jgi:predicted nucleic acid-binding protein
MKLFVDTGAWFALQARTDANHSKAVKFLERFKSAAVTFYVTDYIVDETVTLLRMKASHHQAQVFLDFLKDSRHLVRSHVGAELLSQAEEIFRKYKDKDFSFTDCVSFAYMDELELQDVFTFDHNFHQYGKRVHPQISAD